MASTCLNCQSTITENFCGNCGQKKFKRIDRKYVVDEAQYLLVHTNKGFLYSVKNILKNPGKTARDFIEGNRVNHYKPLLLAFVLSGISALISYKIIGVNDILRQVTSKTGAPEISNNVFAFVSSYNSFLMLAIIPFFAIFTSLVFRKWGQNYFEHIVMNAFGLSFYILITILIVYPILFAFRANTDVFMLLFVGSMLTLPFIFVWFYKGFYYDRSIGIIIFKVLLILLLVFVVYIFLSILAGFIFVVIKGPEALKLIQPHK